MLKFSPLIPVNETSFGNSNFEDHQDRMRSYWIGVGLQSTEDALIRREKLEHTEETSKEGYVMMEAKSGVMLLPAKEHQGEGKKNFS